MKTLVKALQVTQAKGDRAYGGVEYKQENNKLVIYLDYTIYDYELQPQKLINYLNDNYWYEWYDSTTIHVYSKK